nr:hypothetical protein [Kiritimatiellia bacterium]
GYYAANYLHDNQRGKGLKSVTFTPNLPVSGTYEVSMYWSADEHRAHNVPVDVYYDGGIDLVQVNQQFDGGQWNVLGAYEFTAGTSGHVVIGNDNTTGFVIADAVRFVNVTEGSSPPAGGESVSLGAVNRGVAARDHATGDGFILWSEQNVYDRFDPDPYWDNSSNLIAVVWDGSQWLVDNNDVLTPFSPTATDVLIAEVDFTNDTITSLEGVDSTYQGIADGYASGDLTFSADIWNGNPNDGEFTVEGTGFVKN